MNGLINLLAPPVFDDERKSHQARLLNLILWALIAVPIPYILFIALFAPRELGRALTQAASGEAVNIFLLFLLRRGHVQEASAMQVIAFWLFFTATALTGSGVHSAAYLLGYGLVIAIGGVLLGGRGAILMTIIAILSGAAMVFAEQVGLLDFSSFSDQSLSLWAFSAILFPVTAAIQYLAEREIRHALMRAHASEERYRLISRVTSDYTFSTKLDEDGKMKLNWVAGAFEQMTGYTYEEYAALGGWRARLHPDDRKKDEQDLAQLQNNQPVVSEVRTYTKSGDLRWVRISAHPIWDERRNRLAGIVGGVKDITQEKQAQETLNKILLQQAAILNNIPHMAWLKDRDSRYIAVNNSFAKTSGFTPEQISGKTDFDIWRKEFARKYREDDLEVMATKQMRIVEEIQMDSAGNEYWVETIKTPILDENGEAIGTTGIARNISDRKLAESEREKLIRDLEAKNAELERFTYTVSHDLKSPLVTIAGFIGYLEKDLRSNDSEKALHNITRIRQAVEKIQALLNDLLELSRVGRLINPPQEIPFKEIVNEAVEMLAGAIASKGIKLQVQDEFPIVSGDRIRLLEVMQNLLENAVKFMGSQAHPLIQIGTRGLMHDMPVIFVRDNGIGILPEYHEKIFGLFNKLDPDSEGTGIGLALVRRIIEIHGGQIWVESEGFETGATFCFTLPASPRKG